MALEELAHTLVARHKQREMPIVIYGPSLSGKSHFLDQLRSIILKQQPIWNMLAVPAAEFRAEAEISWSANELGEFRQHIWQTDAFLLDDLEELSGSPIALRELYHLLNRLLADGKLIVLSCQSCPRRLTCLPDELRHRLIVGRMVEFQRLISDDLELAIRAQLLQLGFQPNSAALKLLARLIENRHQLEDFCAYLAAHQANRHHGRKNGVNHTKEFPSAFGLRAHQLHGHAANVDSHHLNKSTTRSTDRLVSVKLETVREFFAKR